MKIKDVEHKNLADWFWDNTEAFHELKTFVTFHDQFSPEYAHQIHDAMQDFAPPKKKKVYRGTKFANESFDEIVSGKPFTIPNQSPVRSWSISKQAATNFKGTVHSENYKTRFYVLLEDTTNPADVVIDLTDEVVIEQLQSMARKHKSAILDTMLRTMRDEEEVIRLASASRFAMCETIIGIDFAPHHVSEEGVNIFRQWIYKGDLAQFDRLVGRSEPPIAKFECHGGRMRLEGYQPI